VITGRLENIQNYLGRSTIIDLKDNTVKQLDHRTIEWIVFKNVKYLINKGGKREDNNKDEKKKDEPLWDYSKLAVGNWFSATSYYKVTNINGDEIMTVCNAQKTKLSRDLIENEMYNPCVYAKEEKVALTKLVQLLNEANSVPLNISFSVKNEENKVNELLHSLKESDFKNKKTLAQKLMGDEKTIVALKA
jgi:hypothetical protein